MNSVNNEPKTTSPHARTILVTGGTGTIGSAIVRSLCEAQGERGEGPAPWHVVANFAHDVARANALRDATGCDLWQADVADEEQVSAMFGSLPSLYAVVHCAGLSHNALLARLSWEAWHQTLRVHADGAFLVTRAALENLPAGGRLMLLASRVGERGNSGQSAYAASKAAVIALAKTAAREAGVKRLCVNAICPGFVPSDMTQSLNENHLSAFRSQSAFGQFGTGGAVAGVVNWLLSEAGAEVTGQVIHCDSRL